MNKTFEPTTETITLHGLGFLQVVLPNNQRLHVWHPDLPRRRCFEDSQIHDHRFSFISRPIIGIMHNRVFSPERNEANGTHVAYKHEGPRSQYGNRGWQPDFRCSITQIQSRHVGPGEEYKLRRYEYHSSTPIDGVAVTLMTKTDEGQVGAHSLCRFGVEPDVDFDRKQWSEERLWAVVKHVLAGGK